MANPLCLIQVEVCDVDERGAGVGENGGAVLRVESSGKTVCVVPLYLLLLVYRVQEAGPKYFIFHKLVGWVTTVNQMYGRMKWSR